MQDEMAPTPRAFAETIQMSNYDPGATLPQDIHSGAKLKSSETKDYFKEEQSAANETQQNWDLTAAIS